MLTTTVGLPWPLSADSRTTSEPTSHRHVETDSIWYSPSCTDTPSYVFLAEKYADKLVKVDSSTKLQYGNISVSVAYPVEAKCEKNINNESVVLDVEVSGKRILLTGDAEKEVEEKIFDDFVRLFHPVIDDLTVLPAL